MTIRLLTLGGLHGSLDGRDLERLASWGLSAALLVYLSVKRETTRDVLMALLWPDRDAVAAGHCLSQMLYSLRKTLGTECVEAHGREIRARDSLEADAAEFVRAAEAERMSEAASLYCGPFLHGVHLASTTAFESWTESTRAHLARLFRRASRSVVKQEISAGNLPGAVAAARAWLQPDPLDDEAQHRLIELLASAGERTEALKQYIAYEHLLTAEGLEPLDETKALVSRIREAHAWFEIERPDPEVPGRDLYARVERDLAPDLEVLRLLGRGSTASVFLARESALARLVAVKVLSPRIAADDVARRRFQREARSAARIVHPNVTQIYRLSQLAGPLPYIVMEFVDGRSLADVMAARGAIPLAESRPILAAVASALAAAHDQAIIHRDVNPGNILVESRTARPVLTDFGIAALLESSGASEPRLTPAGHRLGDARYMSPEVARGEPVTDLSDIYALGILAFELLSGEYPYRASSPEQYLVAHTKQEPRKLEPLVPDAPSELCSTIERCLAKVPAKRPRAADVENMFLGVG